MIFRDIFLFLPRSLGKYGLQLNVTTSCIFFRWWLNHQQHKPCEDFCPFFSLPTYPLIDFDSNCFFFQMGSDCFFQHDAWIHTNRNDHRWLSRWLNRLVQICQDQLQTPKFNAIYRYVGGKELRNFFLFLRGWQ